MHCSVFVPWSPYWSESWKKWLDGINKPSLFLGLNCIFFFIDLVRPVCVSVHSSPTNQPQTKPIGLLSRLKLSGFCLFYIFFCLHCIEFFWSHFFFSLTCKIFLIGYFFFVIRFFSIFRCIVMLLEASYYGCLCLLLFRMFSFFFFFTFSLLASK